MLTLALAVGSTVGLGLLAMRYPAIRAGLAGFTVWAGLFIQIAGVLEAMRRIASNPATAFNITPNPPTVGVQGMGPRPVK